MKRFCPVASAHPALGTSMYPLTSTPLRGQCYHCLHFTGKEAEHRTGKHHAKGTHRPRIGESEFEPRQPVPEFRLPPSALLLGNHRLAILSGKRMCLATYSLRLLPTLRFSKSTRKYLRVRNSCLQPGVTPLSVSALGLHMQTVEQTLSLLYCSSPASQPWSPWSEARSGPQVMSV